MEENNVGKAAAGFSLLVLHPEPRSFEMENGVRRIHISGSAKP